MANGGLSINSDSDGLQKAIDALAVAKDEIPARTTEQLVELGAVMVAKAKARVLQVPAPRNAGHTGLRLRIAAGVTAVQSELTGSVTIQTEMDREDEAMLPRGMDFKASGGNGWRHPFFGHDPWFRNDAYISWFVSTMSQANQYGTAKVQAMLEQISEEVAQAS